ncbi:MAG: PA2778 family cysteine peptidase [Methylophilus sp.]|nr:PA2778 family cysteine peptidase [Methylophilus sp.]
MKASVYRICILAFLCLLNACAATGVREVTQSKQLPRQAELTNTPFFPQELYQCGPAALATALNAVDIQVTPEQLTPEVYIPSRQGSLQIEMLAAARRHGAIAVTIPPKLEAVLQEVVAGNVVVVMQNLGFSWAPSWHYAVVVGFDLNRELLWLRSGTFKRFEMSLSAFQRTWARSESWAFVALPPSKLPATAMADDVAKALVAFEKHATTSARTIAYQSAVERWPTHLVLLMGLGNSAYKAGDIAAAARAFQQAIAAHPDAAPAYNNLANVLLVQKQAQQANDIAEKGLAVVGDDEKVRQQLLQTLAEINDYQNQHSQ